MAITKVQVQDDLEGATATGVGADDNDDDAAKAKAKTAPTDDNRPVERLAFRAQRLSVANISVFARGILTAGLVSVDVSGTQLDDAGLDSVVGWTPWLRELVAAGD